MAGERRGSRGEEGQKAPPKRKTTEIPKAITQKISKLMEDAETTRKTGLKHVIIQESKLKQLVDELNASLDALENNPTQQQTVTQIFEELRGIKESLQTRETHQPKTWSQVAAQAATTPSVAAHRARERARERKEKEVIVTIRDPKERDEIREISQQDLVTKIRECCPEDARDAIATVRKTPTGYAIKAKTSEGKRAITSNPKWFQKTTASATYREKSYPVVVHGVLLQNISIDDQKRAITMIQEPNRGRILNLEITQVKHLNNNLRKTQTYGSVIIETTRSDAANEVITRGLALDGEIKMCERYVPEARIRHCTNCQNYGHKAITCNQSQRCANCGKAHTKLECREPPPLKCPQCGGVHPNIVDICHNRRKEAARTKRTIEMTPYLFAKEEVETQPLSQQPQQPQQLVNEWTRVDRRRGRPTDLEKAGSDPKQTRIQRIGDKRPRESITPPRRNHPNQSQLIVRDPEMDDSMSDD